GLIGSTTSAQSTQGVFVGITSATPIVKVVVSGPPTSYPGIDELAFGTPTVLVAHALVPALDLTATLTEKISGAPIAGATVDFATAAAEGAGTTNGTGDAACGCTVPGAVNAVLNGGFTASFAGSHPYAPSSASGTLV
ncbi:MAG: hypothetical protein ACRDJM_04535, partial [Actinomycetota bacterium]